MIKASSLTDWIHFTKLCRSVYSWESVGLPSRSSYSCSCTLRQILYTWTSCLTCLICMPQAWVSVADATTLENPLSLKVWGFLVQLADCARILTGDMKHYDITVVCLQVRRHSVSPNDDLLLACLARPNSIDLLGLGLTVVTSFSITGWPPVRCAT